MIFTVNRLSLKLAIDKLKNAVATGKDAPILEGILFSVEFDRLTLISYNYDIGMKMELPIIKCQEEGDIVISSSYLGSVLNELNSEEVTFMCEDTLKCTIKADNTEFSFTGFDSLEYPELPSVGNNETIIIEAEEFKNLIDHTSFCTTSNPLENTNPICCGLKFEFGNDGLEVIGLDGLRIAVQRSDINTEKATEFLAHAGSMSKISKLIDKDTNEVAICVGSNHVSFRIDDLFIIIRLIETKYLNYNNLLPKEYGTHIRIRNEELKKILRRSLVVIDKPEFHPIKCTIYDNKLVFNCISESRGMFKDEIYTDVEGEGFNFGFNARFMLDALNNANCDLLDLYLNDAQSPIAIKPIEGDSFLFVVMPMRIRHEG